LYETATKIADRGFDFDDIASMVAAFRIPFGVKDALTGETDKPIRRSLGYSESAIDPIGTAYDRYNHEYNKRLRKWQDDNSNPRPNMRLKSIKKQIAKARKSGNIEQERKLKEKFVDIATNQ
jgi:hypothetical protein